MKLLIWSKDLQVTTVGDKVYQTEFFLCGDWKFLALVCGIDSANAEHSCIWCKCPKHQRYDMTQEWSISDTTKGARTIEEIVHLSAKPKRSKQRFNCSQLPLFRFIPIDHVVIDTLHIFLHVADILINPLIGDLHFQDGIEKATSVNYDPSRCTHLALYEKYLNESCKISFKFYISEENKKLCWRDLTGPEKHRLFEHIDIVKLFPSLPRKQEIQ